MLERLRKNIEKRPDLALIADMVPAGTRVLDLGCGDGSLLKLLEEEKQVRGLGVEISQDKILESVANGIHVIHEDLNRGLEFFKDKSFDLVVLSQTLQAVEHPDLLLREITRVGRKALISFINIGYCSARFQLAFTGRMPETRTIPNPWYNTPNIHLATIKDFKKLCRILEIEIKREIPLSHRNGLLAWYWPNLFAPMCVFEIAGRA